MSMSQIARRSVLIFVLTSAVNVAAVVVIGVPMGLGLLPGSTNPRLTLLPAGGALGLVGMLLLFGARPATQVIAAVVIYRAISLWVPALIGSVAFLRLRREIGDPAQRGVCA
jgi:hypothetical protein